MRVGSAKQPLGFTSGSCSHKDHTNPCNWHFLQMTLNTEFGSNNKPGRGISSLILIRSAHVLVGYETYEPTQPSITPSFHSHCQPGLSFYAMPRMIMLLFSPLLTFGGSAMAQVSLFGGNQVQLFRTLELSRACTVALSTPLRCPSLVQSLSYPDYALGELHKATGGKIIIINS